MKLLLVTQVVDTKDPVLGFFCDWIAEFATHVDSLEVICLYEGTHSFPENVHIHSLGKERGKKSSSTYAFRFLRLIWDLRTKYDSVFVHMNPEYVVLGGVFWRVWHKRIALWYTHKNVDRKLRIATFLANVVFSASKESFRLKTSKLIITGHGIPEGISKTTSGAENSTLHILTTGRISKTKHVKEMILALDVLYKKGVSFEFVVAGAPATEADVVYAKEIDMYIRDLPYANYIRMLGPVPHRDIFEQISKSDVFINLSATGSMDKAVLEALTMGVPVVSSNEAFRSWLVPYGLFVSSLEPDILAESLLHARQVDVGMLQQEVQETHALVPLVARLISYLS